VSFLSPRSLAGLIAAILLASVLGGLVAPVVIERGLAPAERARALVRAGRDVEAELTYAALARKRPVALPILLELLDLHARLWGHRGGRHHRMAGSGLDRGLDDEAIRALISAPDLPFDERLLAEWWSRVIRGEASDEDRAPVRLLADASPPVPWANHLLALEARVLDQSLPAAELFAREATAFDDRRDDADAAVDTWAEEGDWGRLATALDEPRFARQVSPSLRLREAARRRDWWSAARWFFPSQYGGATTGVLCLALVSALVWFALCGQIGLIDERPRFRVPIYLAALGLGVVSTYLTLAISLIEHAYGFAETGRALADAIFFVIGVGLREEVAKTLAVLPLVMVVVRWGRRRESLACGAVVGLGFAAEENIGYFHMGLATALARFLTANFLHLSTTALVAVALDDAFRGREAREGDLSRTLAFVVVVHGLYDFFLSSDSVEGGSFLSMFVFVFLTRRFVDALRDLPGRERPLLQWFLAGLSVVTGASFVYASALVGPEQAAAALLEGTLGVAVVAYVLARELRNV
jgi:RsiW-degrading membrane proteinase PrsW (M82 family)